MMKIQTGIRCSFCTLLSAPPVFQSLDAAGQICIFFIHSVDIPLIFVDDDATHSQDCHRSSHQLNWKMQIMFPNSSEIKSKLDRCQNITYRSNSCCKLSALNSIKEFSNGVENWVDGILPFLEIGLDWLDRIVGHLMDWCPIRVWEFIGQNDSKKGNQCELCPFHC